MSFAGAKAAIAAELLNVSWVVPATATGIPLLGSTTAFAAASIFTYEAEKEFRPGDFPIARILVPRNAEVRANTIASRHTLTPRIYVLFSVEKQFSQGGHDLMDAIVDGMMTYFRRHSGAGGTATLINNDIVISAGLVQEATIDPVVVDDTTNPMIVALNFRAMVSPTVQMSIV